MSQNNNRFISLIRYLLIASRVQVFQGEHLPVPSSNKGHRSLIENNKKCYGTRKFLGNEFYEHHQSDFISSEVNLRRTRLIFRWITRCFWPWSHCISNPEPNTVDCCKTEHEIFASPRRHHTKNWYPLSETLLYTKWGKSKVILFQGINLWI